MLSHNTVLPRSSKIDYIAEDVLHQTQEAIRPKKAKQEVEQDRGRHLPSEGHDVLPLFLVVVEHVPSANMD